MKKANKVIFHIDVNSAYLAWEAVERLKNGDTLDIRENSLHRGRRRCHAEGYSD